MWSPYPSVQVTRVAMFVCGWKRSVCGAAFQHWRTRAGDARDQRNRLLRSTFTRLRALVVLAHGRRIAASAKLQRCKLQQTWYPTPCPIPRPYPHTPCPIPRP